MRRWLINLFCLFSLLILVTSISLWVRTLFFSDCVQRIKTYEHGAPKGTVREALSIGFIWEHGKISLEGEHVRSPTPVKGNDGWHHTRLLLTDRIGHGGDLDQGFTLSFGSFLFHGVYFRLPDYWFSYGAIVVPLWLFLLFAFPPILWLKRLRRARGHGFPVSQSASTVNQMVEANEKKLA